MTQVKSTERFSDRVDDYVKFRPNYPPAVLEWLAAQQGLKPSAVVVDVGSGTGISAELFLRNGNVVYGIEPNDSMRAAAENGLRHYPGFHSRKGTSDSTGLPNQIADFVVAAQAFHWFEPKTTKREFDRIKKNEGKTVLIWNDRRLTGTRFSEAYEALVLKYATDYQRICRKNVSDDHVRDFLGRFELMIFDHHQDFDFDGLSGRLTSSSYMPRAGQPRYEDMEIALRELFDLHNRGGRVRIEYDTQVFVSVSK